MRFRDRRDAGRRLAARLSAYEGQPDVFVLGLPRGGVPVAFEVARALRAPLDVFLVRKLGLPGHEELAMGAIASGGVRVLNQELVRALEISRDDIEAVTRAEEVELARRERTYRADRPAPDLRGKTVLLVDDGLATGTTMHAAVTALRPHGPARTIVAVPVGAAATCSELEAEVDRVVCAQVPDGFAAVGQWYEDFAQTSDDEVRALLAEADAAWRAGAAPPAGWDPRAAH
jgi:putative phosphoribosyl transferase